MDIKAWSQQLKEPNLKSMYEFLHKNDGLTLEEMVFYNNEDFFERLKCSKYEAVEKIYYGDWKSTDPLVKFNDDGTLTSLTLSFVISSLHSHKTELSIRYLEQCYDLPYTQHLFETYGNVDGF